MRFATFWVFIVLLATVLAVMAGVPVLFIGFIGAFIAILGGLLISDRVESHRSARAMATPLALATLPPASIGRRAALAVLLMIGFYALAFGMVAILALIVFLDLSSGRPNVQILFIAGAGIVAIISGILAQQDAFEPPWPQMTELEQPRLFAQLKSIAAKAGQAMPDEVYVLPELNAWVADRGGVRGAGSRRVMGIGLPVLQLLDVSQFSAVIAHEFGHYYGGDTQLGPWIHKTRSAIGRTLEKLSNSRVGGVSALVNAPFQAYGKLFLRVTHAVSRQQEHTADQFAAALVSPQALITALKRMEGYAPGVALYWQRLLIPTLGSGYRPSMTEGLARVATSEHIAKLAELQTAVTLKEATVDPLLDTHPPLRDRVAALEALSPGAAGETAPALSLLDNIAHVEDDLLCMYMSEETVRALKPIAWDEVPQKVYLDYWAALREHNRKYLEGWTVVMVPEMMKRAHTIMPNLVDENGQAPLPGQQAGLMFGLLRACVALALRDAGWTFVADPGRGVHFARGEHSIDIDRLMLDFVRGVAPSADGGTVALGPDHWANMCNHTGITDLPMTGASGSTTSEMQHG